MRRLSLVFCAVALLAFSVAAFALETSTSKEMVYIPASGYAVLDSSLTTAGLATSYTIYGVDASDDFWVRRYMGDHWEAGPGAKIPAGRSIMINAPQPVLGASGYYRHFVQVGALADSAMVIPWVR